MVQAVEVAGAAGAPFWHALGLSVLATIARGRGEHPRAEALLAESSAVCQAEQIAWPTALNLSLMCEIATDLGQLDRAEALGRAALRQAWATGNGATSPVPWPHWREPSPRGATWSGEPASTGRWTRCSKPPALISP